MILSLFYINQPYFVDDDQRGMRPIHTRARAMGLHFR
jgi:hypothetical protein